MNISLKNIGLLFAGLVLCACSEDSLNGGNEGNGALPIELGAAYPSVTRASDNGFEHGDKMGVYVADYDGDIPGTLADAGLRASNVRYTFNGTDNSWSASTAVYWRDAKTPADIVAYYPYIEAVENPKAMRFSVSRRQDVVGTETTTGGYEHSDLLWAKATKAMPTAGRVDLTLNHLMAGVRVTLREGSGFAQGEWNGVKKTVLVANVLPDATVDLENGKIGMASGSPISITPYIYNEDWRAVVIPQTVAAGSSVIDISVDGKDYHLKKSEAVTYTAGKMHTFTITVDKRGDSGDYEFTLSDEGITAWMDDADFRDGIVRNYLIVDVPKKGTLKDVIKQKNLALSTLTELKLTGEINGADFDFLRDDCFALKALNLQDVTVWGNPDYGRKYQVEAKEEENVIPSKAMFEKKTLTHIVFPKNLKIIGSSAFHRTSLMGSLIIPEGVEKIGGENEDRYGFPNVLNRDIGVFSYCKYITGELSLPSTLTFIETCAFAQTKLSGQLVLPEKLKNIGSGAFENTRFTGNLVIPSEIEYIGKGAFYGVPFTGDLTIPTSVAETSSYAFQNCDFDGVLSIPNEVMKIGESAFDGCGFRGELQLPSKLKHIGDKAFSENKFSSVIFPEGLFTIGKGCFKNCSYLSGEICIPSKVTVIGEAVFSGCTLIDKVVLHDDVKLIDGAAFNECHNLTVIECKSEEPPVIGEAQEKDMDSPDYGKMLGAFSNISLANVRLQVPKASLSLYKGAKGWKDFGRISEYANFVCRPAVACALNSEHSETIVLDSEGEWEMKEKPDWCTLSKASGSKRTEIVVTINALAKGGGNRSGKIVFGLKGTDVTTECAVSQYDYKYAEDECVTLQKATVGNGIDVLFVGDGWDAEAIANGKYLEQVNRQMEAFFGIEPYTTYRNRFNVYACVSLSQETGVNTTSTWRNTKFGTFYQNAYRGGTGLNLDNVDDVFDYAVAHSPLTNGKMPQSLIIMSLNSDEYGGVTIMTENGSAVSICSPSDGTYPMDTRGIVQHEACGHAFGKLAEERITTNLYVNKNEKNVILEKQWRGWYQNISLVGSTKDVHWSHLIFDPRYSDAVDVFEGAYGKTRGVYRAEINSCMNYGIPYFSAISRQDIMKRILEYSGEGFTMEKFYATDSDKWGATENTRAAMMGKTRGYVASGRHQEVRIVKSKKY